MDRVLLPVPIDKEPHQKGPLQVLPLRHPEPDHLIGSFQPLVSAELTTRYDHLHPVRSRRRGWPQGSCGSFLSRAGTKWYKNLTHTEGEGGGQASYLTRGRVHGDLPHHHLNIQPASTKPPHSNNPPDPFSKLLFFRLRSLPLRVRNSKDTKKSCHTLPIYATVSIVVRLPPLAVDRGGVIP